MSPERRRDLLNRHSNDLSDADLIEWLRDVAWKDHMLWIVANRLEALSRAAEQKE